jgi:hypothetical protein
LKLLTITGTGSAMVSTPAMAHKDPTILPHTPTGLCLVKFYLIFMEFFMEKFKF